MQKIPKVTVLMPVYNGKKYLKEAIESILNQTLKDFEFIIINDASTDNSAKILSEYSDSRILIVQNKKNLGITKSLNKGLKLAQGDYIARMDADDISLSYRLKIQVDFLDTHPKIICVGGDNIVINSEGKEIGIKKSLNNPGFLKFHMMLKNQFSHPSAMFRRQIISKEGNYNEKFINTQDYELWSRLLLKGYLFSNISIPILKYRFHRSSQTQGLHKKRAYSLAITTTYKNLLYYFPVSKKDFKIFMTSFHKHKIYSYKNLIIILNIITKFRKAFLKKENLDKDTTIKIKKYLQQEKIRSFQWYLKSRFKFFYKIIIKIKYFLTKKQK